MSLIKRLNYFEFKSLVNDVQNLNMNVLEISDVQMHNKAVIFILSTDVSLDVWI